MRSVSHDRTRRQTYQVDAHESRHGHHERKPEKHLEVAGGRINPYPHRGRESHGKIVAESVIADSHTAVARGEGVDCNRGISHGHGSERQSVDSADYGEEHQSAGPHISEETYEEKEKTAEQHLTAVKTVDDEPAERTHQQTCHHIAREHKPHHVFVGGKLRVKVYRQQGRKDIKGEEQQKIAGHRHTVV